jgi:cephalosporin hydroxylase
VLRYGMAGLNSYDRAIVGTQQWYMGPGQQGDVLVDGYDDDLEDHLFEEISWPTDGYRLFDIGHFIGDRDWLDGLWESNCLFAPRALLAQAGCFDEAFSMPGGGYANLELYERLGSSPDVTAVTILGEGSFHQSHGGTTTNQPDIAERNQRLANYAKHYADLRGRTFRGLDKQMHYVGAMSWEACRTRARRRVAPNYFRRGAPDDPDGRPTKPTPIPDDLNTEFIDAYWRSFKWRDIEWMGQRPEKAPGDLLAYQELLWQVRPDWVIETNNGGPGGRAVFLASICELLGHGQVVSIDAKERDDRPGHPRLTHLTGSAHEDDVVARVRELTGDTTNALVILGTTGGRKRMLLEFEAYKPLVPPESYIVVENTIVNGHPVWASFGIGPHEAVTQILADHREFATDTALEKKYATTFNAGGYLKRVR